MRYTRFMTGRYGLDKFGGFLLIVYLLLAIVARFMPNLTAYLIVLALALAALVYAIFRFVSRDTHKRYLEGQKFDGIYSKVKSFFKLQKNRFRDRKTHVYKKCRSCGAILRFRRVSGTHTSNCPRCGNVLTVKIR